MKNYKILFAFALIIFCFTSCSKTVSTDTTYSLKAKIDDKWVTYSDAHFFVNTDPVDPNMIDLQVYAGNYLNNLNISIQSTAAIAPGDFTSNGNLSPYRMFINLFKNNGQFIQTYGSSTSGNGNQPFYTLTITSYNETELRGTISGNYLYDAENGVTTNFTEGEFVARKAN